MEYTAVIRTLGTAGEKYYTLLDSLSKQTVKPKDIIVYIAEGYAAPKRTVGIERYIYVKKGMVAQRALPYTEVETEYILFLDDDVFLPNDAVERMFHQFQENKVDVISPDVFPNSDRSARQEILMTLSGRMRARRNDTVWGYKVMCNAGYSYNKSPQKEIYCSQTNAGPCFFCAKNKFTKIHFEHELWLDRMPYALGEDQVMYYKMYLAGWNVVTWFHSGILHLDAGSSRISEEKANKLLYCDLYFKTIFWHRFLYLPETSPIKRLWKGICIGYTFGFALLVSTLKGRFAVLKLKAQAIRDGIKFIHSVEYRALPLIKSKL